MGSHRGPWQRPPAGGEAARGRRRGYAGPGRKSAWQQGKVSDGAPAQVVCGMNGCLNVGRGCRGERRAAGNGEVAVVICGQ